MNEGPPTPSQRDDPIGGVLVFLCGVLVGVLSGVIVAVLVILPFAWAGGIDESNPLALSLATLAELLLIATFARMWWVRRSGSFGPGLVVGAAVVGLLAVSCFGMALMFR